MYFKASGWESAKAFLQVQARGCHRAVWLLHFDQCTFCVNQSLRFCKQVGLLHGNHLLWLCLPILSIFNTLASTQQSPFEIPFCTYGPLHWHCSHKNRMHYPLCQVPGIKWPSPRYNYDQARYRADEEQSYFLFNVRLPFDVLLGLSDIHFLLLCCGNCLWTSFDRWKGIWKDHSWANRLHDWILFHFLHTTEERIEEVSQWAKNGVAAGADDRGFQLLEWCNCGCDQSSGWRSTGKNKAGLDRIQQQQECWDFRCKSRQQNECRRPHTWQNTNGRTISSLKVVSQQIKSD